MSIKTILALADGDDSTEPVLAGAVGVARCLDAHLEVLHVSPDPATYVPLIEDGMPVEVIERIRANAASLAVQERDAVRAAYDRICAASGLSVSWQDTVGSKPAILPAAARLADLLTMAKPNEYFAETLEAALFESGRPVLILPRRTVSAIGNRIVVAWNGSVEAARAVTAAVPFLRLATQVDVVMVGDVAHQAPPDALVPYLARHGVKAAIHVLQPGNRSIGDELLEAASRFGADLLVMGAYGHSRLREWVLGGATLGVLTASEVAVLMIH